MTLRPFLVTLLMLAGCRATHPADPMPPSADRTFHWQCGSLAVGSRYGHDDVRLSYDAREITLPIAMSASGARYADARGNEFWTKGAAGTLTLAGEPPRDCVETSP